MTTSPARKLSSALQGGFLLQVLQEDNKHQKIVSGSAKQLSTYSHIENNANTIKSTDVFHGASQHRNQAFCIEYFYCFPQHVQRGGFLGTSCRSRDRVPPLTGSSLIRTWVTQPCLFSTSCLNYWLVQD